MYRQLAAPRHMTCTRARKSARGAGQLLAATDIRILLAANGPGFRDTWAGHVHLGSQPSRSGGSQNRDSHCPCRCGGCLPVQSTLVTRYSAQSRHSASEAARASYDDDDDAHGSGRGKRLDRAHLSLPTQAGMRAQTCPNHPAATVQLNTNATGLQPSHKIVVATRC